jgi:hypothetical protein
MKSQVTKKVPENEEEALKDEYAKWDDEPKRFKIRKGAKFNYDFVQVASRLMAAGFSEADLGYALDVTPNTIKTWKARYPQFKKACGEGKRMAKRHLVAQGLRAAAGYEYETSKTKEVLDSDGKLVKTEIMTFKNHQPPNHNLIMWMLCNIDRQLGDDEFKSKHTMEINHNKSVDVQIGGSESQRILDFAGSLIDEDKPKHVENKEVEKAASNED